MNEGGNGKMKEKNVKSMFTANSGSHELREVTQHARNY